MVTDDLVHAKVSTERQGNEHHGSAGLRGSLYHSILQGASMTHPSF